jgi:cytochrome c-type biogenesis protein CcmF
MHPNIWLTMVPEWGHLALILTLGCAITLSLSPMVNQSNRGYQFSKQSALAGWLMTSLACALLIFSFLTDDFSVRYVAQNSNTLLPWYYKACALWGAHEGSLLLWLWMLSTWTLAVAFAASYLPQKFHQRILSVLGMITVAMVSFTLFTSNPFIRYLPEFPAQGLDLNPLLQDPGLIAHPPLLYAGYVGFSVAYAFALAALIEGKMNHQWAQWALPWTNAAFALLTCGIVLGSWWSYRQLGWGGWWYWDPVENASLMPWLLGCALIHSLQAVTHSKRLFSWCALLAIATFSLSLLGTFLVRSGILVSVHSFASDPSRGRYLIILLMVVVGASLTVYATRQQKLTPEENHAPNQSPRLKAMLGNNLLLTTLCLSILLATLYPSIMQLVWGETISIGPPYYQQVLTPVFVVLVALMCFVPNIPWNKTGKSTHALSYAQQGLLGLLLITTLVAPSYLLTCIGYLLGASLTVASISMLRHFKRAQQLPMILAHLGVAIAVLAITTLQTFSSEQTFRMHQGSHAKLSGYTVTMTQLHDGAFANYKLLDATFLIQEKLQPTQTLHAQLRHYITTETTQAKVAILNKPFVDLYIALAQPIDQQDWVVKIYYKPGIRWIWYGFLLIALAALTASYYQYKQCKRIKETC